MCSAAGGMMGASAGNNIIGTTFKGLQLLGERNAKKQQKNLSLHNARLQKMQISRNLEQNAEAVAQRNFQLARQVLIARGKVQNSGLGERSIRALSRAVGFEASHDQAVISRNFDIMREDARTREMAVDVTHYNNILQIGDTSDRGLTYQMLGISAEGIGNSLGSGGNFTNVKSQGSSVNIRNVGVAQGSSGSTNDYNFESAGFGNVA